MPAEPRSSTVVEQSSDRPDTQSLYQEGIIAGVCGATAIAVWFLLLDLIKGRPFYTPTVLGTALFRGGEGLAQPEALPIDFETVFLFTWVHFMVFAAVGGIVSRLLGTAERNANFGFGILLLFVFFEGGFVFASMTFAESLLQALAWPAILVGNLLAAVVMAVYFWQRHPNLRISP